MKDILKINSSGDELNSEINTNYSDNNFVKSVRLILKNSSGNDQEAFKNVQQWFLDLMWNASGRYKVKMQQLVLFISLIIVSSFNIDSFALFQRFNSLSFSEQIRKSIVKDNPEYDHIANVVTTKIETAFPLGWSQAAYPHSVGELVIKICGLLMSTMLVAFSAIMLFDILGKYVNVRNAVKPFYDE